MTLPPLPEPAREVVYNESKGYSFGAYTDDQMRAYGEACAAAERERCLDICEQHYSIEFIAQNIAAAIRAYKETP